MLALASGMIIPITFTNRRFRTRIFATAIAGRINERRGFAHPGSYLAGLFIYTEPRFHFNRSQRTLSNTP